MYDACTAEGGDMKMAISTAKKIADAFLHISRENRSEMTNLKLQKLLYYAQAWYLAIYEEVLFDEPIEAWVHGPVVPEIFRMYRHLKWSAIPGTGTPAEPDDVAEHLQEVWNIYGGFNATKLERLTHNEDPWKKARRGLASDVPSRNVISTRSMKEYYSSLLENAQ
jgi:uncharacterized phage-associated protein